MRIVIAGGTGFIGRALVPKLVERGCTVTVLTRQAPTAAHRLLRAPVTVVQWRPTDPPDPGLVEGADAVVNLAGATIARRWTPAARRLILESRVQVTTALVEAIRRAAAPPRVLVNASAVGFYGPRGDEPVTEADGPGSDFLAQVCLAWEAAAGAAQAAGVRVVLLRTGLVLGRGGALSRMRVPFLFFVGGPLGSGRQWVPWIHMDDVTGLIAFSLENKALQGPVNGTAPNPVRNREFAAVLGRVLRRPAVVPTPAFLLRWVLGEMSSMLLTGQRAVPAAALRAGYSFRFPTLEPALRAIYGG
ncbi:MAG TPA: TIGR01777 family oxidoreductase [Limnochordales bacterium]